jgi:hypothetical protein
MLYSARFGWGTIAARSGLPQIINPLKKWISITEGGKFTKEPARRKLKMRQFSFSEVEALYRRTIFVQFFIQPNCIRGAQSAFTRLLQFRAKVLS